MNHYYFRLKYLDERLITMTFGVQQDYCLNSLIGNYAQSNVTWLDFFESKTVDFISIKYPYSEVNGQYFFKGNIVFDTKLQPGESIFINVEENASYDQINIECIEQKLGYVLGKPYSLKVFNLKAFSNGVDVESDLDELEFILSKSYGFVKFIPFIELLSNPKTTATLYGFEDNAGELIGKRYNYTHFFPYQEGDVLRYYLDDRDPQNYSTAVYSQDSITSVIKNQDTLTYTVQGTATYVSVGLVAYIEDYTRSISIKLNSNSYAYIDEVIYGFTFESSFSNCVDMVSWSELDLSNVDFSFGETPNSYNIQNSSIGNAMDNNCGFISEVSTTEETRITNSQLGQLELLSLFADRSASIWLLVTYQRGDQLYAPCAPIDSVYTINDTKRSLP